MSIRPLLNPDANADDDAQGWTPLHDRVVAALRQNGIGQSAPAAGDPFPDLSLPDVRGVYQSISGLNRRGPLIVSFQRGLWCPYCSLELRTWREVSPALTAAGVTLVIISGELGDGAQALETLAGDQAIVLCDVDHGAALACGLAFRVDDEMRRRYLASGLDLATVYGSDSWFLPVPATFLIGADGVIRFASADPDFRLRADPRDIAALASE